TRGSWDCGTTTQTIGGTLGITCTVASLISGASAPFTLVVKVNSSATGTLSNTANANSVTTDPGPLPNSATVTTAAGLADIQVTKSVVNPNPHPGLELTYTISVKNKGPNEIG